MRGWNLLVPLVTVQHPHSIVSSEYIAWVHPLQQENFDFRRTTHLSIMTSEIRIFLWLVKIQQSFSAKSQIINIFSSATVT